MNKLLETAVREVEKLPQNDQDAIAAWLLEELASERRWSKAFAASQDTLASLADDALAAHRKGRSQPLNTKSA
ncbi:MAG: hypothetical protein FJ317_02125 [SAR202 cluster bacterium]|nr:hypothetical protein [SAR202 cluster bacterium]